MGKYYHEVLMQLSAGLWILPPPCMHIYTIGLSPCPMYNAYIGFFCELYYQPPPPPNSKYF